MAAISGAIAEGQITPSEGCADCFICEIELGNVDLDQSLFWQQSIEQKLQHLHVAGLGQLDALADEFCLLVSKQRLRDCRCSVFGPVRATRIALGEGSASRKFRVLSRLCSHNMFSSSRCRLPG